MDEASAIDQYRKQFKEIESLPWILREHILNRYRDENGYPIDISILNDDALFVLLSSQESLIDHDAIRWKDTYKGIGRAIKAIWKEEFGLKVLRRK